MSEKKYLWLNNGPQNNQTTYIYLNEKGEKIIGNIVSNSNIVSPYSEHSIYKNAVCSGEAHKYVTTENANIFEYVNPEYIGLTDVNKKEFGILTETWKNKY